MEQLLLQLNTAAPNDEIRLLAKKISNEWHRSQRTIFPIGIPDVDRAILESVDDLTLIRICSVNHYLRELHSESFWERRCKNNHYTDLDNYLLPGETYKSLYPLVVASRKEKKVNQNDSNADLKLIKEIICKGYAPLINNLSAISSPVSALILAAKNNKGEISGNLFLVYYSYIFTQEYSGGSGRMRLLKTLVNKEVITAFVHNMSPESLTLFIKHSLANIYIIYIREREKFIKHLFIAFINDANIEAMKIILPHIQSNKVFKYFMKSKLLTFCLHGYVSDSLNQKEKDFLLEVFFIRKEDMFSYSSNLFFPVLINDLLSWKLPFLQGSISGEIIDYYRMVIGEMMKISFELINTNIFLQLYPLRIYLRFFIKGIINTHNVDHLLVRELIEHRFVYKDDIK